MSLDQHQSPDAGRCPIASDDEPECAPIRRRWIVAATLAAVALSYFACASAATYPVILTFGSRMPGQLTDPLEHLWLMRWSRSCLLEGRSPFFCPSLNAPTGVPLGYFPTLHVQTLGYLALRLITENDVACFNTLWFSGFVATGLGGFVLAWWVTRDLGPAWLAGLGVMLCGPMLMHAHGHLETMQMGAVPPFLIAWLRFVDSPGRGRLALAAGLYLLVVACAPYFAVLAIFPAAWYVAWSLPSSRSGTRALWIRGRSIWLSAFGVLVVPGLILLFSNQVWAAMHGYSMTRTRLEFDRLGAPAWSSFVPSPLHALGRLATPDVFAATGYSGRLSECSSYLGGVTLALLTYAAIRRLRFPKASYWWSALGLMVVLSWGSSLDLGRWRIGAPAGWIYGIFPPFHLIRVPARFNLFAAVCAAVPASAALVDLKSRIAGVSARWLFGIGCAGLMLADLAMIPFETAEIPPMPPIYRDLVRANPAASFVEVPLFGSDEGQVFSSLWGYWQSQHRGRTTAGYPGLPNVPFESEIVRNSPFQARTLRDLDPTASEKEGRFAPAKGVALPAAAWLFLSAHGFDHVVVHQGVWTDHRYDAGLGRLKKSLSHSMIFEDGDVAVFSRERMSPPGQLAWLAVGGIRPAASKPKVGALGVLRLARLAVYNPDPKRPIILTLDDASAFAHPRQVRLLDGDREVARWIIEPGTTRTLESRPFTTMAGLSELTLASDGDDRPSRHADRLDDARTPYSLRIDAIRLRPAPAGDRPTNLEAPR